MIVEPAHAAGTRAAGQPVRWWRRGIGCAVVAVVLVVTGCGKDKPAEPRNTPQPGDTTSSSASGPSREEAGDKARTAYDTYMKAYANLAVDPNPDSARTEFARYVAEPRLSEAVKYFATLKSNGIVYQGLPIWKTDVTSAEVTQRPYTVAIQVCFDGTPFAAVYKATGKSAEPPGIPDKYVITAKVTQFDDGAWRLTEENADRSRSC